MKFPLNLTISIGIKDQSQAVDTVAGLIDWERSLRSGQNNKVAERRLANSIAKARQALQYEAGLVRKPQ